MVRGPNDGQRRIQRLETGIDCSDVVVHHLDHILFVWHFGFVINALVQPMIGLLQHLFALTDGIGSAVRSLLSIGSSPQSWTLFKNPNAPSR